MSILDDSARLSRLAWLPDSPTLPRTAEQESAAERADGAARRVARLQGARQNAGAREDALLSAWRGEKHKARQSRSEAAEAEWAAGRAARRAALSGSMASALAGFGMGQRSAGDATAAAEEKVVQENERIAAMRAHDLRRNEQASATLAAHGHARAASKRRTALRASAAEAVAEAHRAKARDMTLAAAAASSARRRLQAAEASAAVVGPRVRAAPTTLTAAGPRIVDFAKTRIHTKVLYHGQAALAAEAPAVVQRVLAAEAGRRAPADAAALAAVGNDADRAAARSGAQLEAESRDRAAAAARSARRSGAAVTHERQQHQARAVVDDLDKWATGMVRYRTAHPVPPRSATAEFRNQDDRAKKKQARAERAVERILRGGGGPGGGGPGGGGGGPGGGGPGGAPDATQPPADESSAPPPPPPETGGGGPDSSWYFSSARSRDILSRPPQDALATEGPAAAPFMHAQWSSTAAEAAQAGPLTDWDLDESTAAEDERPPALAEASEDDEPSAGWMLPAPQDAPVGWSWRRPEEADEASESADGGDAGDAGAPVAPVSPARAAAVSVSPARPRAAAASPARHHPHHHHLLHPPSVPPSELTESASTAISTLTPMLPHHHHSHPAASPARAPPPAAREAGPAPDGRREEYQSLRAEAARLQAEMGRQDREGDDDEYGLLEEDEYRFTSASPYQQRQREERDLRDQQREEEDWQQHEANFQHRQHEDGFQRRQHDDADERRRIQQLQEDDYHLHEDEADAQDAYNGGAAAYRVQEDEADAPDGYNGGAAEDAPYRFADAVEDVDETAYYEEEPIAAKYGGSPYERSLLHEPIYSPVQEADEAEAGGEVDDVLAAAAAAPAPGGGAFSAWRGRATGGGGGDGGDEASASTSSLPACLDRDLSTLLSAPLAAVAEAAAEDDGLGTRSSASGSLPPSPRRLGAPLEYETTPGGASSLFTGSAGEDDLSQDEHALFAGADGDFDGEVEAASVDRDATESPFDWWGGQGGGGGGGGVYVAQEQSSPWAAPGAATRAREEDDVSVSTDSSTLSAYVSGGDGAGDDAVQSAISNLEKMAGSMRERGLAFDPNLGALYDQQRKLRQWKKEVEELSVHSLTSSLDDGGGAFSPLAPYDDATPPGEDEAAAAAAETGGGGSRLNWDVDVRPGKLGETKRRALSENFALRSQARSAAVKTTVARQEAARAAAPAPAPAKVQQPPASGGAIPTQLISRLASAVRVPVSPHEAKQRSKRAYENLPEVQARRAEEEKRKAFVERRSQARAAYGAR